MSWDDVRIRLEREVAELGDDGFVIVTEPTPPAGPPRGLLRRRHQPPSRYVQVRATEGGLFYAECVGATLFDGDWEVTAAQHDQLRALGWFVPGEDNPWDAEQNYPNYFRYDEGSRAAELARLCVESLEILGADADGLVWQRGH